MIDKFVRLFGCVVKRVSCHHSYNLVCIDLGVHDEYLGYWFECVHCGKTFYVPLWEDHILQCK